MLKDNIKKYILIEQPNTQEIELFKEEKEYILKNQLAADNAAFTEKDSASRFADAFIERGNKETEEMLAEESADFLKQPINYFREKINEFMYLESNWFNIINVDAVSFEVDDVFRTYDVMLGLKLPKKYEERIKGFLQNNLQGDSADYDLMFSQKDGLWDFNFSLNNIPGFKDDLTVGEAYHLIYRFLFKLAESVE